MKRKEKASQKHIGDYFQLLDNTVTAKEKHQGDFFELRQCVIAYCDWQTQTLSESEIIKFVANRKKELLRFINDLKNGK